MPACSSPGLVATKKSDRQVGSDFLAGRRHVAHPILGHLQLGFPFAVRIGHAHQHLALLDRPVQEQLPQLPGGDLAVDRAGDDELLLLLFFSSLSCFS